MESLYRLESAALQKGAFSRSLNVKIPEEMLLYTMRCIVYAVSYYITTGRASSEWEKAFSKANPQKLLSAVAKSGSASDTEYIKRVTSYLHRYCGLPARPSRFG